MIRKRIYCGLFLSFGFGILAALPAGPVTATPATAWQGARPAEDPQWKLHKNQDGITVYTGHKEGSIFQQFKAVMTVPTSVAALLRVANNLEAYPTWLSDCKTASSVKQVNAQSRYAYLEVELAWPLQNRDFIVHMLTEKVNPAGKTVIHLKGQPDLLPEKHGIVRIQKLEGAFTFTPKPDGMVEVTYQFFAEPGGYIPAYLTNKVLINGPYRTLSSLRSLLQRVPPAAASH